MENSLSIPITEPKLWTAVTKLEWNANLKSLVLSCIDEPEFSSRFPTKNDYAYYWSKLIRYMDHYYDLSPEKPDKFIFLLLLTYPRRYVANLRSFLQLKIAFNELIYKKTSDNSDFTCIGYYYGDNSNCICSQHIENVYEFQNNLSGIIFNVGSVCNNRHRVVEEDDENYKLMKRAERDRREERKNGWPEGTIENKRIQQKLIKQNKQNNQNNQRVKNPSTNSNNNSSDDNSDTYMTDTRCYICSKTKLFCQRSNGQKNVCSTCIPARFKTFNKKVLKDIIKNVAMISCFNCKIETKKLKNTDLCLICKDTHKLSKCLKCIKNFTQHLVKDEIYCPLCEPTVKKCVDCSDYIMYSETHKTRCSSCFKMKKQNEIHIDKICEKCNIEFDVTDEFEWRTICNPCYKKGFITCNGCNKSIKILTVQKESKNKGRNFCICKNMNCPLQGVYIWL